MITPLVTPPHRVGIVHSFSEPGADIFRGGGQSPKVAILLCTYQGANFLAAQLDSIAHQTHTNWKVWASDDGSTDTTRQILSDYKARWGHARLSVVEGPAMGPTANFLTLTCRSEINADFFAWSDQDDVWEPHKLERALSRLGNPNDSQPALYGSRTQLIDALGQPLGSSPWFRRRPAFSNALVQNIAGGNTMVFNGAVRALLMSTGADPRVVAHDWWAYLLVTACGGQMHYDFESTVLYRQHSHNVIGGATHPVLRIPRLHALIGGRFQRWVDLNLELLQSVRNQLPLENLLLLDRFALARQKPWPTRMWALWRSGVYRQTCWGNIGLALAAMIGRL